MHRFPHVKGKSPAPAENRCSTGVSGPSAIGFRAVASTALPRLSRSPLPPTRCGEGVGGGVSLPYAVASYISAEGAATDRRTRVPPAVTAQPISTAETLPACATPSEPLTMQGSNTLTAY